MKTDLRFKRIYRKRMFPPGIVRRLKRDTDRLPKHEVGYVTKVARRSMKKAPKKPKSRFGRLRYRKQKPGRHGRVYWQKGLYSRPGHPPFWHEGRQQFNLRRMNGTKYQNPSFPIPRRIVRPGQSRTRYVNWIGGPMNRGKQFRSIPVPALQEYGGTVNLKKTSKKLIVDRGQRIMIQPYRDTQAPGNRAVYPARPYMRPAGKMARRSSSSSSPNSLKKLVNLGGLRGRRVY